MLIVCLAALHLGISVVIELTGFLFDLGLTAEQHTLRANNLRRGRPSAK